MAEEEKSNPYVTKEFCNERTNRIEEKIDSMKTEILFAIKDRNSIGWKAKATIIASLIISGTSIVIAFM